MVRDDDRYVIGVDFGTLSGRAVVVRVADGAELGTRRARLPARRDRPRAARLGDAAAAGLGAAGPRRLRRRAARRRARAAARRPASTRPRSSASAPTSPPARWCRRSPTARRCASCPSCADRPHAYVKLWKHHAAQPQADRINALAARARRAWLARYGGLISSEWEFAKGLQLLEEDPEVYAAMERWVEAADWIVWQLCRHATSATPAPPATRASTRTAHYPSADFLAALNPDFAGFVDGQARRTRSAQLGDRGRAR